MKVQQIEVFKCCKLKC
ncbi:hypothetical protein F383_17601 [Gossypium arboreum]|uniref:Uncharacterized protein n=1 Tax=Gossypium arboreum TaxID=29729 RepID=A0A0B0NNI7_GOSAR|nr:hypothetical protein F383_17601 [Gossypium arboreum]